MTDGANTTRTVCVDLEPVGRRATVPVGQTILAAAQSSGVELVAVCGGAGVCETCRVRLARGEASPPTLIEQSTLSADEIASGYRLACQAGLLSDARVEIPPESLATPQRLQLEGQELSVIFEPAVAPIDVQLDPPNPYDLRADDTRLKDTLAALGHVAPAIGAAALADCSDRLRAQGWVGRVAVRGSRDREELVALLPPGARLLGLAVDIGTTKLAAYLVDLEHGVTIARAGAMNPQIAYGEDVVSRIAYADHHAEGRDTLRARLVEALNELVAGLCAESGVLPEQIVEAVAAGNTAMHHLFAGLPVRRLGQAPYLPAVSQALDVRARDVGLQLAAGAYVHLPPNIAGYVGADHVAMLLATGVWDSRRTVVALDIGTNTEISLAYGGRLWSCSCASGPAFEGAHIHDGMRAAPGAIERVQWIDKRFRIHTIGNQPPVGICGSGILDAVATMRAAGALDERGTLLEASHCVRRNNGQAECVLAPASTTGHGRDVVVTRGDVHEIQLAKGAIRAGVAILLAEAGITEADIDDIIVAGAFGTYLDLGSAIRVGMFPDLPIERFRQVGNAAGMGAIQMLVSSERRRAASDITRRVTYVELTTHPAFTDTFLDALYL
jgi:uncharacterized 2Fe-2S/4Fe-4S cluster protein (DUF4445 family)